MPAAGSHLWFATTQGANLPTWWRDQAARRVFTGQATRYGDIPTSPIRPNLARIQTRPRSFQEQLVKQLTTTPPHYVEQIEADQPALRPLSKVMVARRWFPLWFPGFLLWRPLATQSLEKQTSRMLYVSAIPSGKTPQIIACAMQYSRGFNLFLCWLAA